MSDEAPLPGPSIVDQIGMVLMFGGPLILMWLCLVGALGLAAFLAVDYVRDRRRRA